MSSFDRRRRRLAGGPDDLSQVSGPRRGRLGTGGRLPRHRQHGAFGGSDHGSIGDVGALAKSPGEPLRIDGGVRPDADTEATENLGEDHTRVAARTHQGAVGGALGHGRQIGLIEPTDVLDGGLQGQQHVRPGVAVRNREHVERIHLIAVDGEPGQRGNPRVRSTEYRTALARLCVTSDTRVPYSTMT